VRDTERLVARRAAGRSLSAPRASKQKPRDLLRVEERLADMLAARVEIRLFKRSARGDPGEIAIRFSTLDELNGLLDKLGASDG
jgi:ParB family transcriptional regulator, chromosome partitioning protein